MLTADQLARLVQDFYATLLEQDDKIRPLGGFFGGQVRKARIAHYATIANRAKAAPELAPSPLSHPLSSLLSAMRNSNAELNGYRVAALSP